MSFRPKRVSGADLAAQLSPATADLPSAVPAAAARGATPHAAPPETASRPPPVVQVNFKASVALADLIALEAEKAGSTRRFIARLMRDAGFVVPDADTTPADNRRRRGG